MFKEYLLNSITQEMKLIRRLASKVPADKMNYKATNDTRSIGELLQYLSFSGTGFLRFWYRTDESDLKTFFGALRAEAALLTPMTPELFVQAMDKQIAEVTQIFEGIAESDLHNKQVTYPWGDTAPLGAAIIETSVKWLSAYKLQLFTLIKQGTGQKLNTPDAWRLTVME